MTNQLDVGRNWTKESVQTVENKILQQIESTRTTEAAESYARFLRLSGLDSDNYPLFLKMLEIENHWVLDELIGPKDPFLLISTIPPNDYLIKKCFMLLT